MDIGGAFFFEQERTVRFAAGNLLPYSLAEFRQAANRGGSRRRARGAGVRPSAGIRIPSWPSEPAGPCTCRSSDRGGVGGATRRNPCPRHRSASSARPPNDACHAARAMFFYGERPYRCPLGVLSGASSAEDGYSVLARAEMPIRPRL